MSGWTDFALIFNLLPDASLGHQPAQIFSVLFFKKEEDKSQIFLKNKKYTVKHDVTVWGTCFAGTEKAFNVIS